MFDNKIGKLLWKGTNNWKGRIHISIYEFTWVYSFNNNKATFYRHCTFLYCIVRDDFVKIILQLQNNEWHFLNIFITW